MTEVAMFHMLKNGRVIVEHYVGGAERHILEQAEALANVKSVVQVTIVGADSELYQWDWRRS